MSEQRGRRSYAVEKFITRESKKGKEEGQRSPCCAQFRTKRRAAHVIRVFGERARRMSARLKNRCAAVERRIRSCVAQDRRSAAGWGCASSE